jgi:transcriptional regulator with XRE-family HTH domain
MTANWQDKINPHDLGERLLYARNARRMSRVEVAEPLGVNQLEVLRWEQGKALPTATQLLRIAREVLGEDIRFFIEPERPRARFKQTIDWQRIAMRNEIEFKEGE